MEFQGALEAEKLTKQKWEQYCETPCKKTTLIYLFTLSVSYGRTINFPNRSLFFYNITSGIERNMEEH